MQRPRAARASSWLVRLLGASLATHYLVAFAHPAGLRGSTVWSRTRQQIGPRVCLRAVTADEADLEKMLKRELIQLVTSYGVDASGLTKPELVQRARDLARPRATPAVTQRQVAEIAMDEWQNATTVGFDCKSGRHTENGVEFDIIGPDGNVQHRVHFSEDWPPTCTCADAQQWGDQQRCKHVCMILVKCGVPYAAVADGNWSPGEMEIKSIVYHMKGKFSPIPLQDA